MSWHLQLAFIGAISIFGIPAIAVSGEEQPNAAAVAEGDSIDFESGRKFRFPIQAAFSVVENDHVFLDARGMVRGVIIVRDVDGSQQSVVTPGQTIQLVNETGVVDEAILEKDGTFALNAGKPGKFEVVGQFQNFVNASLKIQNNHFAVKNRFQEVKFRRQPKADNGVKADNVLPPLPPALAPGVDLPADKDPFADDEENIGTAPNGNEHVFLDADGQFRFLAPVRRVHHASNDEIYLDAKGMFRGVVTFLDEEVVRRPLPLANVYMVQRGSVVSRGVTRANGSFTMGNVLPGSYTIVAEYGYHTLDAMKLATEVSNGNAKVKPPAPWPTAAWEQERNGEVWQRGAGQLAIQRIAVRGLGEAMEMGNVAEFTRPGAVKIIQVRFQEPKSALPVLHLSPAPWAPMVLQAAVPSIAGGAVAGGAAPLAGAAGGGAAAAAGIGGLAGLAPLAGVLGTGATPGIPVVQSPAVP